MAAILACADTKIRGGMAGITDLNDPLSFRL